MNFNNPWIISIVSIFLSFLLKPFIDSLIEKIKSIFGTYSGNYISITEYDNSKAMFIEYITISHNNNNLKGIIKVLGKTKKTYEIVEKIDYEKKLKLYSILGFQDERVLVMSYKPKRKNQKGVGTILLKANDSGEKFYGRWANYEDDKVGDGKIYWIKTNKKFKELKNSKILLDEVNKCLHPIRQLQYKDHIHMTMCNSGIRSQMNYYINLHSLKYKENDYQKSENYDFLKNKEDYHYFYELYKNEILNELSKQNKSNKSLEEEQVKTADKSSL